MLGGKKIVIIDVETTGFSYDKDFIIEVGLVEVDLETGKKLTLYDELISPPLPYEDLAKTWIIQNYIEINDVIFAEPLEKHFDQIQGLLNLYTLGCTAFNNVFDFGFMEAAGFDLPKKLACPMRLSTDICKLPAARKGVGRYKYPKAEEAYNYFFPDANYIELHRGADDAWHEADIVKKLYDLGIFKID